MPTTGYEGKASLAMFPTLIESCMVGARLCQSAVRIVEGRGGKGVILGKNLSLELSFVLYLLQSPVMFPNFLNSFKIHHSHTILMDFTGHPISPKN